MHIFQLSLKIYIHFRASERMVKLRIEPRLGFSLLQTCQIFSKHTKTFKRSNSIMWTKLFGFCRNPYNLQYQKHWNRCRISMESPFVKITFNILDIIRSKHTTRHFEPHTSLHERHILAFPKQISQTSDRSSAEFHILTNNWKCIWRKWNPEHKTSCGFKCVEDIFVIWPLLQKIHSLDIWLEFTLK